MKPEEQRIAIAEACGWNSLGLDAEQVEWWIELPKEVIPKISYDERIRLRRLHPPDYLNDLNAMHEAEKTLRLQTIKTYVNWLWQVMDSSDEALIGTIHATASQRAEAFLRTLGLWKEEGK